MAAGAAVFLVACQPSGSGAVLTTGTPAGPVGGTPAGEPAEGDLDGDGVFAPEDCNDADASVFPEAPELCDGQDNDCNGGSDEPFDTDGDGWGHCAGDCHDTDPAIFPGAPDLCDGKDNDCDGDLDEDDDADGDGWATCQGDCDDGDPEVHLWAVELCDGVDNDCNGLVDDGADADGDGFGSCDSPADCDDLDPTVFPGAVEACDGRDNDCDGLVPGNETDGDGDGVRICDGDCDDTDPARAPDQLDACDGIDNDCDPLTDELLDGDGDGLSACDGDCDDTEIGAFPGGVEVCDGVDNDCSGVVDQDPVCSPCTQWSFDGHSYLFCPTASTWDTAQQACLADGYDLLAVNDGLEDAEVSVQATLRLGGSAWCGFNDRAVEGLFVWSNGDPVSYTGWSPGEPNNAGNEDCAQVNWWNGQWNDAPCTTGQPFVCETR